VFAAIYHPVGTPMVIDAAKVRGRTMAFNGICGNIGVSIASGCTAVIASAIGWRYAFFIPGAIFILTGFAYLKFVPDDGAKRVVQAPDQDVALSRPATIAVIALFMVLALWVGLVFNAITIMLPKLVEQRALMGSPLVMVGGLATAVFLCGGLAQFMMGRAVERLAPHVIMSIIAVLQVVGVLLALYTSGWWLLPSLALAVATIYGQVTVNDLVLARYTPAALRGRVYAIRFFLIFTTAGPAAWGIGQLYERGGFNTVLGVGAVIAALGAINTLAISGVVAGAETKRAAAREAAQPAE
jgi:sugar phosphate permease